MADEETKEVGTTQQNTAPEPQEAPQAPQEQPSAQQESTPSISDKENAGILGAIDTLKADLLNEFKLMLAGLQPAAQVTPTGGETNEEPADGQVEESKVESEDEIIKMLDL